MILIFCGLAGKRCPEENLVVKELARQKIPYRLLNPHALAESSLFLLQRNREIELSIDGKEVAPTHIYMAHLWRTDSLLGLPSRCKYPAVFRSQIHQFLQDLRFSFESVKWVPGKIESLERADSKTRVFIEAARIGMKVPAYTYNSFSIVDNVGKRSAYRKKLGYPFVVSLNTQKGYEVGVTTTNQLVRLKAGKTFSQPWQWQEPISATSHVRCCVVGGRIWSVRSFYPQSKKGPIDFRYLNEVQNTDIRWEDYQLPSRLQRIIVILCKKLGICSASPEFLIDQHGNHVLIDLNPCGDWALFFSPRIRREIAREFVNNMI